MTTRRTARLILWLALVALALPFGAVRAAADDYRSQRDASGQLFNIPVYDPQSKSYFALYRFHGGYEGARSRAMSTSHNGVRGRLAIIATQETSDFIKRELRPASAYFGLQLVCHSRDLVWVNNEKLERGKDFADWGRTWHAPNGEYIPCKQSGALYGGGILANYGEGQRWYLIDPGHFINAFLVEFPTGKP